MIDQGIMTLVTVAIFAACGAFVLYVLYSVTWRAVRRGLQEYYEPQPLGEPVVADVSFRLRTSRHLPVRVPDYVPNDWN